MEFLDQIQHYWFIIVFVGGVIGSWVRYEGKIEALKTKIDEDSDDRDRDNKELRQRLREVETKAATIDSITGDIKSINAKLDILLKKANL